MFNSSDYLTPSVKRSYAHHICICRTESSGKTTLSTELEKEFEYVTMIPEIGRCLVGNAVSCEFSTLMSVLTIHKTLLEQVIKNPPTPIVVWDTDNLTTKSYMEFFELGTYKEKTPIANVYFFLDSNIPYEKDISRLDEEIANKLKFHHFQLYKNENVNLNILNNKINVKEYVKDYIQKQIKIIKI